MNNKEKLNTQEKKRYVRQININGFGEETQILLLKKKVFICGLGGLGSVVANYLTAAGVGKIILADCDKIDISNLNRQILHNEQRLGLSKVVSAIMTLENLNSDIELIGLEKTIDEKILLSNAIDCDLIIDCLDNYKTREIINEFSVKNKIPFVYGSVSGFQGQVSFINPPQTPCFNCFFQPQTVNKNIPILGATCGIIGAWQAMESLRFLAFEKPNFLNKIIFFDANTGYRSEVKVSKNNNCKVCGINK